MDRGYSRVFGLTKNTLLLAFSLAGVNVRVQGEGAATGDPSQRAM
jgi:hypothetical protein